MPSFRGVGSVAETAVVLTPITPGLPTGWQPGDEAILATVVSQFGGGTTYTASDPLGWTSLGEVYATGFANSRAPRVRLARRRLQTGDTAPLVQMTGGSGGTVGSHILVAAIFAVSSAADAAPTLSSGSIGDTASVSATGVTTPAANCLVVAVAGTGDDNTISAHACTDPSSLSEALDNVTTTGGDAAISIAHATRTTAGATGNYTATYAAADPWGAFVLAFAPPGQTVAVGQASETATALSVTARKARAVGLVAEVDSAHPVSAAKARAVGIVAESDAAQPVTVRKTLSVGVAVETDAAQLFTPRKTLAVGLVSGTDAALPVVAVKARALGIASDVETAHPVGARKTVAVGMASDAAVALALTSRKTVHIGITAETDAALPLGVSLEDVVRITRQFDSEPSAAGAATGRSPHTYRGRVTGLWFRSTPRKGE